MAAKKGGKSSATARLTINPRHMRTSIGASTNTRTSNKRAPRRKKYKGQGK